MEGYIIIVLVFGVLILGCLILLFFVNRLTSYKNKVESKLDTIQTSVEHRVALIEDMVDFVQENLEHEQDYAKQLEDVDVVFETCRRKGTSLQELKRNEEIFLKFVHLDETYPELKKRALYQNLKQLVELNHDRLVYTIDNYDKGVTNYNNYREKRFIHFLSELLKFPEFDYYNK